MTRFWTRAVAAAALGATMTLAHGAGKTEITLARFFGACDADFGKVVDASKARGECGIITALVNEYNATNKDNVVVKPQIAEWGPFYDQLTARIVAKDVPTISVMHESVLGDYVSRKLVEPLDDGLKAAGVNTGDYTEQAKRGTTFAGKTYALPMDTWSWLWHINGNLMKKAGLTNPDGSAVLPKTADELLVQARKFKAATGKPYFAWAMANETAAPFRTFLTLLYQQNAPLFEAGNRKINLHSPEAVKAIELMNTLYAEGLVKPDTDYSATNQAFLNGDAGVVVVGTWTIDEFMAQAEKAASPLNGAYSVVPFPNLYAKKAVFADGHSWVMLKGGAKDEAQRKAALSFLKFLWDRNGEWARTGHLPANQKVADSEAFKKLPFRAKILEITRTGVAMPNTIPRQRTIESVVGEELASVLLSKKPIPAATKSAEDRVNKTLATVK